MFLMKKERMYFIISIGGKVFCITLFCLTVNFAFAEILANTNQSEGTSSKRENPSISVNRVTVIIVTTVIAVVLLAGTLTCSFYRRIIAKRKGINVANDPNYATIFCTLVQTFSKVDINLTCA